MVSIRVLDYGVQDDFKHYNPNEIVSNPRPELLMFAIDNPDKCKIIGTLPKSVHVFREIVTKIQLAVDPSSRQELINYYYSLLSGETNENDALLFNRLGLGTAAKKNVGDLPGNIPLIDLNGKLPLSILPELAITDVFVVNSEVEMLALHAQRGDFAVRTDTNSTFALKTCPASQISNWVELPSGNAPVKSVNGKTGNVILTRSDLGLDYIFELITLTVEDIQNKFITLSNTPNESLSMLIYPVGGMIGIKSIDFIVDSLNKKIIWDSLAYDGLFEVGEILSIGYYKL